MPFYLSDLVISLLFFVNLPTNFFPSGVTPWRVSPGAVRSPRSTLVTQLECAGISQQLSIHIPSHSRLTFPIPVSFPNYTMSIPIAMAFPWES